MSSKRLGKEDKNLIASLRNGSIPFNIILGTTSLLATGTNIPQLDTLIIAGDLKSDVLAEQGIGRITRIHKGKQKPKVIDIADRKNIFFKKQAEIRKEFYKSMGWEII